MKKLVSLAAGLALVAGASTAAQAQTCTTAGCTVNHTVSATAPTILKLSLSSATTTLTNPVEADFDGAAISDAGPSVSLKSNTSAHAQISSTATWTGTGYNSKSIGDLEWKVGAGAFAPISGTATDITTLGAGTGNRSANITWGTLWHSATDTPGTYSLVVTFTLASP
jgi:hypothetical protein